MGALAHFSQLAADTDTDVVTVTGRHRLPTDVVSELMDVLTGQPRVVVCDLAQLAVSPQAMAEIFAPVAPYLTHWAGTLVVVCVPDPAVHASLLPTAITSRLLVHAHFADGVAEAQRLLSPLRHTVTFLPPVPAAAHDARAFTEATLRDWRLPLLAGSASLVVSELVTDSMLHARTVLGLALSRCEDRVRVAVHDHGGGRPFLPAGDGGEEAPDGRGPRVVEALTRRWGVFPTRSHGKTVWAVMDAE